MNTKACAEKASQLAQELQLKRLFLLLPGDVELICSSQGVSVTQMPHDLPYREVPAYDAVPKNLLTYRHLQQLEGSERADDIPFLFQRVTAFIQETGGFVLRMNWGAQELYSNCNEATLYETSHVKRKILPGYKKKKLILHRQKLSAAFS
jgi:hypothetical protein